MDSDAASDTTMQTAPSRLPPPPRSSQPQTQAAHSTALEPPKPSPNATRASSPVPMEVDEPAVEESVASAPSFDLLDRIPGMYRLLDLVQERGSGSGGMVDKIIIAQASIQAFANKVHPGSYRSDIQVDFKTLDQHVIKPRGIYGSASTIVDFLDKLDCMDDEVRSLMLRRRDESSGVTCPTLRPGLYLLSPLSDNTGMVYIIFWPEDGTWQDGVISSVSRNRVTFMRYLTKLCDQTVCLISEKDSAQLVWKDEATQGNDSDDEGDDYDAFDERIVGYTVEQTKEEQESAQAEEGFILRHRAIEEVDREPDGYPAGRSLNILQPRLIVGETAQGILKTVYIPEEMKRVQVDETPKTMALQDMLSIKRSPIVLLSENIDRVGLEILLDHGLWGRCGKLQGEWKARTTSAASKRDSDRRVERSTRRKNAASDKGVLDSGIKFWISKQAARIYPIVPELQILQDQLPNDAVIEDDEYNAEIAKIDSWLEGHPTLIPKLSKELKDLEVLEVGQKTRYVTLKRRLLRVLGLIENKDLGLSSEKIQKLADLITKENGGFKDAMHAVLNSDESDGNGWNPIKAGIKVAGTVYNAVSGGGRGGSSKRQDATITLPFQQDPSFARLLETLYVERPQFQIAIKELKVQIAEILRHKVKTLSFSVPAQLERGLHEAIDEDLSVSFEDRRKKEERDDWEYLRKQVKERLANSIPKNHNGVTLYIASVVRINTQSYTWTHNANTFRIKGWLETPKTAGFEYTILPVDIKQNDAHAISTNPDHICRPVFRMQPAQPIGLPVNFSIRHIQLLEKDRAFVIIEEARSFRVYIESLDLLSSTISQGKAIKTFYTEKLGNSPLFALDESRRFLAILATVGESVQLYLYTYDTTMKTLNARGSAENVTRCFQPFPKFSQLVFISGTEEILLVERGGMGRVFSFVTANFRPSNLQLNGNPESAFSSSDGACLLVKFMKEGTPSLKCYHWASFGSNEGTDIPWPDRVPADSQMIVSSVGNRQSTHAILLARREGFCESIRIRITSSSSEFAFRSNTIGNGHSDLSKTTVNNSLIDCHAEVWTRFPVNAAIVKTTVANAIHRPRSLLFVSSAPTTAFSAYFDTMAREFEYKTRKPTKGILKQTVVTAFPEWDPASAEPATSEFQTGDWLVGLFCLIPIHLAVTRSNRFIPLKDGVDSPKFEHSLLGANVAQISEALSFGWYESIFSSYLANKPVKVVTSMGEQSVGKSFALNHFVDTSFAGSAMRCTEGVWLSVTPTRDYLVVAMDFEGVHSIERSAQEDTLLVLLNAAISNFVLFRNNFALSRDITGLFSSFQSCTKVLDPALNPSLFHSTLGIIIKDVIDSDTREIVNEFQQKFQHIVQKERAENFISKLHRGKLDIIPWPVIESARFYDLFIGLKKRLDRQPITHKHAGAFLGVLKMLMAKLKANDWGALDQNLAVQRAQHLSSLLPLALAFGTTDPVNEEPLKNYDTDELLDNSDSTAIFFIDGLSHPLHGPLSLDACLAQLRLGWNLRQERYTMAESEFITGYNTFLRLLVEARIDHVQRWIEVNTIRFKEKAEVTTLLRTFDQLSKDLKASVVLCGSKCSLCGLHCLGHKQHDGDDHNCMTDHKCPELCGFEDQHEEAIGCDLPAGHIGRHVCSGTPHLCGMQCQMFGKNGCLTSCTKSMDHDEDEGHQCAAGMHTCGEPCSLVQLDGTRLCTRSCTLDCRIDHEKHVCDRSLSCPKKCQLCNSYCAAGDHFHALEPDAVHLCGQNHTCPHDCELDGVCEINTTPQSIESTFVGRHTTYQYTKYTQEARRLKCIVSLAPDQLTHDGRHVHVNDPNPFHYCEERCKHCGYYCTLPLGHPQAEHSTNHGSMSHTEWFVEGDDDATLEVQGRKYATGDSGAPMLCSLVCETLGRHVHIDTCRPDEDGNCIGAELEHINRPGEKNDWITHRLFWARSGFKDPYSKEKQDEFVLCDHRCGGPDHDPDTNTGAKPSYCTLPLFHGTPDPADVPPLGHISHDGHAYQCKNPALMQRAFHIFFVLDQSGSMTWTDRQPLPGSPATQRIVQRANNRFGAVISSLYGFWTAREAAVRAGANTGQRRDAYSIVQFDHNATVTLSNDMVSDSDQLLDKILGSANYYGGTNFTVAIDAVQKEMEATWVTERSPVIIFLSDGECDIEDSTIYDICRVSVRLGKPLAFHTVSFGQDSQSHYLRRMATIAGEVYDQAPPDPLAPAGVNPCSFSSALDTVSLASTFLSLAESLKNPRAALSRV